MAKPIPLAPDDTPNPSTSRPRRRQHSSSSTPSPSSALLSTLAAIVASSPLAASSPAPLSFLCPSIAYHHTPSHTIQQRSTSPSRRIKSRRSPKRFGHSRVLPFKFEPGEDGVWRRVETYTLYGSTVCSVSAPSPVKFSLSHPPPSPLAELSNTYQPHKRGRSQHQPRQYLKRNRWYQTTRHATCRVVSSPRPKRKQDNFDSRPLPRSRFFYLLLHHWLFILAKNCAT